MVRRTVGATSIEATGSCLLWPLLNSKCINSLGASQDPRLTASCKKPKAVVLLWPCCWCFRWCCCCCSCCCFATPTPAVARWLGAGLQRRSGQPSGPAGRAQGAVLLAGCPTCSWTGRTGSRRWTRVRLTSTTCLHTSLLPRGVGSSAACNCLCCGLLHACRPQTRCWDVRQCRRVLGSKWGGRSSR